MSYKGLSILLDAAGNLSSTGSAEESWYPPDALTDYFPPLVWGRKVPQNFVLLVPAMTAGSVPEDGAVHEAIVRIIQELSGFGWWEPQHATDKPPVFALWIRDAEREELKTCQETFVFGFAQEDSDEYFAVSVESPGELFDQLRNVWEFLGKCDIFQATVNCVDLARAKAVLAHIAEPVTQH